ncbi:DUF4333 domain-containing protein [Streptomyces sp. NPDC001455]|uniref:DUF4333 domain-containing protein n=2 Tax=Streptomyces TaxID=1883 RepID=UPI00332C83BF
MTIKMLNTDTEATYPPRLLDQEAVERQAAGTVRGPMKMSRDGVECPTAIEAEEGNQFDCRVWQDSTTKTVYVKVIDAQGRLSMSTTP